MTFNASIYCISVIPGDLHGNMEAFEGNNFFPEPTVKNVFLGFKPTV
jgi:hypothetical protein